MQITKVLALVLAVGVPAASFHVSVADAQSKAARSAAGKSQKKSSGLSIATKGDELSFNKESLSAKAGQSVSLTFENKASKTSNLQHNWVLVKPGTADAVSTAGITAGADKGYIPDSPDIIAHTKLVNSGEKDTIHFTAPSAPGDYPYICTFPGHSTTMKGVLKVK